MGVDYSLTFAAVMDLSTAKGILALASTWIGPAEHGGILSAYAKADKEEHLDNTLKLTNGMSVFEETMREHGDTNFNELLLDLRKSLYGLKQASRL